MGMQGNFRNKYRLKQAPKGYWFIQVKWEKKGQWCNLKDDEGQLYFWWSRTPALDFCHKWIKEND